MRKKLNTELIPSVGGGLLGIVSVIKGVSELRETIRKVGLGAPLFSSVSLNLIVLLILIVVGVALLVRGLRRRSRLLQPDKFILNNHKGAHLVGRTEEINAIAQS